MVKRLEDYDAAQKIFLQNASHELRTPLMSIQGYAEGIKHGVFPDTANAADVIVSESLRLSALVDDLLYLSKLETTEDFYKFMPISLGEVVGQCAEKLEGAAIQAGKTISLPPCPEAMVSGDGEKLLRAVMNLAGNCLRYAAHTVEMSVAEASGRAVVTVRDDGPGFEPEDMQSLFTRFYKGKQGKFGLGLSIAKAIVEKHGGAISACNGPAGGAVFTVELPLLEKA
jgi:two-component system sensor histidine kinase CssS